MSDSETDGRGLPGRPGAGRAGHERVATTTLVKALGDDNAERWQTLKTDDSEILIDLSQVVYVRRESGDQKVGF